MARTVSMSIGEFMRGEEPFKVTTFQKFVTYPLVSLPFFDPLIAGAESTYNSGDMTKTVDGLFAPIMDLMRAAGLPVCGVMLGYAAFLFMCAKNERAWRLIQGAGIGYIVLNLIPLILNIFTQIGNTVSAP